MKMIIVFLCLVLSMTVRAEVATDINLATKLDEQAISLFEQGKYSQAKALYEQSLTIREKILGKDHLDVATSLDNLASLYKNQADQQFDFYLQAKSLYEQAEPLYKMSLVIREKALGKEHLDVAESLYNLAELYRSMAGFYKIQYKSCDSNPYYIMPLHKKAKPLYDRSLAIRKKILGKEHLSVAKTLTGLAMLYHIRHGYQARRLLEKALAIYEKIYGKEHASVANTLNSLAATHRGRYRVAEYGKVLVIYEKLYGTKHPLVATIFDRLAKAELYMHKYTKARQAYEQTLAIYEQAYGKEHTKVAESLHNLAKLYSNRGGPFLDFDKSKQLYERSLIIRENVLGKEHPKVAESLYHLAKLYSSSRTSNYYKDNPWYDVEKSQQLYERALTIIERSLGKEHPAVGKILISLGNLYDHIQGGHAKASLLRRKGEIYCDIIESSSEFKNGAFAIPFLNLADLSLAQNDHDEATFWLEKTLTFREELYKKGDDYDTMKWLMSQKINDPLSIREFIFIIDKIQIQGKEHPELLRKLNELAKFFSYQDRYAFAELLYKKILVVVEKAYGKEHPKVVAALNNLTRIYQTQAELLKKLNELAKFFSSQNRYAFTELLYKKILVVVEKTYGKEHPKVVAALNNLAKMYQIQGDHAKAQPLYKRVLSIVKKAYGKEDSKVVIALNNLAGCYQAQDDYTKAEPLFERVLAIDVKAYGWKHPNVVRDINSLASLYKDEAKSYQTQGNYTQAELVLEQANEKYPGKLIILDSLIELYYVHVQALLDFEKTSAGYARSKVLYEKALAIAEREYGKKHPKVVTVLNNFAKVYQIQGDHAQAQPLYKRVLTIVEETYGKKHSKVAIALSNLAVCYHAQGHHAQAQVLYKRALTIAEETHGKRHPEVATVLNNLARSYQAQGHHTLAKPLFERALTIHLNKGWNNPDKGWNNPDVARSLNNLAGVYRAQGNYMTAKALYKKALKILTKSFNADHPDVRAASANFSDFLAEKPLATSFFWGSLLQVYNVGIGAVLLLSSLALILLALVLPIFQFFLSKPYNEWKVALAKFAKGAIMIGTLGTIVVGFLTFVAISGSPQVSIFTFLPVSMFIYLLVIGGLAHRECVDTPSGAEIKYAGFQKRFIASSIDWLVLIALGFITVAVAEILYVALLGTALGTESFTFIITVLIGWLYHAFFESSLYQATPGKMMLGVKVTDLDGNRISFVRATGRDFSKWVSELILFIGFLMVAFTPKRQGLHDKMAGCLVVNQVG